jgi:WD40 repeat protein
MNKHLAAAIVCIASVSIPFPLQCRGQENARAESIPRAPITSVAVDNKGQLSIDGSQDGLIVRTWPELQQIKRLPTSLSSIYDIEISPDGHRLVVAGGTPGEAGSIELYEWPSGEKIKHVSPHEDVIYATAWSHDSRYFATASADKSVQTFDLDCQNHATLLGHSRSVMAVDYLPNGLGLLSAGVDTSIRYWDLKEATRSPQPERTLINHTKEVFAMRVRPSSVDSISVAATISQDRTVRFWQPTIGRMMRFVRLESVPYDFCWQSNGRILVAACHDGKVRTIDSDSAQVLRTIDALDGIAYSIAADAKDGLLVGGANGQLRYLSRVE